MTAIAIPRYFNPTLVVEMAGAMVRFEDGQGLNVRFSVRRTMTTTPDSCSIAIAGLDPDRAARMGALFAASGAATLTVQAGYDGLAAGIFRGAVRSLVPGRPDGPEVWTLAAADDGGDVVADVPLRVSNAGMTAANMVAVAAAAMGLTLHPSVGAVLAASDPSRQGPYTAAMVGKAADLLDAAARRVRARWWVRDGQVLLGSLGNPDRARPAVDVPTAALIEPPTPDGSGLVRWSMFLDPNLVPGSQARAGGVFHRVEAVDHTAETRRGLWTSKVMGRAL